MTAEAELGRPGAEPLGIVFDLDGTLVDTVQLRIAGWQEALRRSGIELDREFIAAHIGADPAARPRSRWQLRQLNVLPTWAGAYRGASWKMF